MTVPRTSGSRSAYPLSLSLAVGPAVREISVLPGTWVAQRWGRDRRRRMRSSRPRPATTRQAPAGGARGRTRGRGDRAAAGGDGGEATTEHEIRRRGERDATRHVPEVSRPRRRALTSPGAALDTTGAAGGGGAGARHIFLKNAYCVSRTLPDDMSSLSLVFFLPPEEKSGPTVEKPGAY